MTAAPQSTASPTVLVVDDEPEIRELARTILELNGLEVVDEAADGTEALLRFTALDPPPTPSVVVLDNRMPGLSGLQVAEQMLDHHPGQVIILFSAYLDSHVVDAARALGVTRCVSKTDVSRLPSIIRAVLPAA